MAKDISKMSKEELARERAEAESRIRELRKAEAEYDDRRKSELRRQVEDMLKTEGFSVADIFGAKQTRGARGAGAARMKGEAKYRHPENREKTWTGKGRQPAWYKEHIEKGGKPEDLAA